MNVRPREPSSHRPLVLGAATLLAAALGCTSGTGVSSEGLAPTEVAVDPEDFLGAVPCSSQPGALRSYVVTLSVWDDADDTSPFTVGSSLPTPCTLLAGFQKVVVVGKRYTAEIDGYEDFAHELAPFGGSSGGAREMLDAEGERVSPRWRGRCGTSAADATVAVANETRRVAGCTPLEDTSTSATLVSLSPAAVLGADPCARADTLDIEPLGGGLAAVTGLACDAPAPTFAAADGVAYRFYVRTHKAGAADLGAECFASAREGETIAASCAPPSSQGALAILLGGSAGTGAPGCPADHFFDVVEAGATLNLLPLPCVAQAVVGPLAPGIRLFNVFVYDAAGKPFGDGGACGGEIEPGRTTPATCVL
jgi:hypothetical protein